MIEINLLPKEMRKATGLQVPKWALVGLAACAVLVIFLGAVTGWQILRLRSIDAHIAKAQQQADQMREDIQLVDRLVEVKSRILARLSAIDDLDRGREAWVKILDEIASRVPDFLWLREFRPTAPPGSKEEAGLAMPSEAAAADTVETGPKEKHLEIKGYSYTLNSLANFMIQLNKSDYFDQPILEYAKIVGIEESRVYEFSMNCRLEDPVAVEEMQDIEGQTTEVISQLPAETGEKTLPGQ